MRDFVSFDQVQKTYDGTSLVIRDLDLQVAQGEFVTLLGPSGSGKSTALMLLAGFEQPTGGTIRMNGRTLNSVAPFDRNIGMVFQNYALFPHMTVADNIAYPLKVRRQSKAQIAARVHKALDFVQLGAFADRYPRQLSGGQQQRVAVARALVFDPALVLMDEPLGALDKSLREEMQVEIRQIHDRLGITKIFVTHDQDEALTMSNRIAVFNDGQIQQIDAPSALYEQPQTEFVARFIGDANMIEGRVQSCRAGQAVISLPDGPVLHCVAPAPLTVGARAMVCLRPERVNIAASGDDGPNALAADLVHTTYRGASAVLTYRIAGDTRISAQVRAGNPALSLPPGTRSSLIFSPRDARAFPLS